MIHLGDITKLHGDAIPPVDCITGGSPCQDLSVAGKRAGLDGERSGLFMEQIRIVKEMRERDRRNGRSGWLVRPRYMVWENVPGAFSSNKGEDFRVVLEEIVKIVEADAPNVPMPDKGKWPKAGCLYSDVGDWSIAWRVHDAQFWGVPQRRKRIALVADFGGLAAPEILFERKGLSRDSEPCGTAGEGTAAAAQGGAGEPSAIPFEGNGTRESHRGRGYGEPGGASFTLNGTEQHGVALSFQERAGKPGGGKGILIQPERTGALSTLNNQSVLDGSIHGGQGSKAGGLGYTEEISPSLKSVPSGGNTVPDVLHSTAAFAVDCRNGTENEWINGTLQAKEQGQNVNSNNVVRIEKP